MLVTTLTKKMAEDLTDYLLEMGLRVRYLHSNIDTIQRIEILRDLRLGEFDVLVGINLLREGLDLPEVSLVAILDADKEGFLRSETSLIQTIGRAARNVDGQVIMYADRITDSMQRAISETHRRRALQQAYNVEHGIDPQTIRKAVTDILVDAAGHRGRTRRCRAGTGAAARRDRARSDLAELPHDELARLIPTLEEEMREAAAELRFEYAARLRDEINDLQGRAARSVAPRRPEVLAGPNPRIHRSNTRSVVDWSAMSDKLVVRGAREHNLRNISLELPRDQLIVFTGLSGSGKSSLAFDTIYAEGQRRYVESLSAYARQFLGQMDKPDVDFIEGLSPAISIDQKSASRNPRSTVGTITEIYDYLRLLYARIGVPHCPDDGTVVQRQTPAADRRPHPGAARRHPLPGAGARWCGAARASTRACSRSWPARASPGPGSTARSTSCPDPPKLARYEQHTIEVVVDRLVKRDGHRAAPDRLAGDGAAPGRGRGRGAAGAAGGRAAAGRRDPHLQPAPGLPDVRAVLRRAGAPQLLASTRPTGPAPTATGSAPASRSTPSWSCRPRPVHRARAPSPRGAAARGEYFGRVLEAVAETYGFSTDDARGSKLKKAEQKVLLFGAGHQAGPRPVPQPVRAGPQLRHPLRGRGARACSGGTPRPSPITCRETIEGYMREVPCPVCGGARLKPESLAVTVDGRNIFELCDLSLRDADRGHDRPASCPSATT